MAISIDGVQEKAECVGWHAGASVVSQKDSCQALICVLHLSHVKGALLYSLWCLVIAEHSHTRLGFCSATSIIRTVLVGWFVPWGQVMVVLGIFNTLSAPTMYDSVSIWMCEEFL